MLVYQRGLRVILLAIVPYSLQVLEEVLRVKNVEHENLKREIVQA